jgi:hypothetical protein
MDVGVYHSSLRDDCSNLEVKPEWSEFFNNKQKKFTFSENIFSTLELYLYGNKKAIYTFNIML